MPKKKSKAPKKKCAGKYCRRKVQGMTLCPRCRMRKLKEENPLEYCYRMQRSNAQRRKPAHFPNGIPFTITREDYAALWEAHPDKWREKKASVQSRSKKRRCRWEVDRIDPFRGYVPGNLRIVSKVMNIYYWHHRGEFEIQCYTVDDLPRLEDEEEVPF